MAAKRTSSPSPYNLRSRRGTQTGHKEDVKVHHRSHGKQPGQVLVLGDGIVGQLGLGDDVTRRKKPTLVPLPEHVLQVAAGGVHTVCLGVSGSVYTFGCNDEGALGRETTSSVEEEEENSAPETRPGKVVLLGEKKVVQVSAGNCHTAALVEDGSMYLWGSFRDSNGVLGSKENRSAPVKVPLKEPVVKVASGAEHLVLLTVGGNLYTAGCGEKGQLGRVAKKTFTDKRRARRGLGQRLLVPKPVRFKGKVRFMDAFCGESFTFALSDSGRVYAFGLSNYHQLGTRFTCYSPVRPACFADPASPWVQFSGGEEHALCLDTEGRVYSLGSRNEGRLGLGDDRDRTTTTAVRKPVPVPGLEPVSAVSCGSRVSLAVARTGSVYAWGMGSNLQLGTGEEEDAWSPVKMTGKQLEGREVLAASGGGLHTVLLVRDRQEDEDVLHC